MASFYSIVGFSTSAGTSKKHQWKLFDNDLIAQDLLNHFNTRVGQRVGRPTFGCRIWEYLMQQKTPDIVRAIRDEIERVCTFDDRIEFEGQRMIEIDHGVISVVSLKSKLDGTAWDLSVKFDERQGLASRG